jgi:hypothetical protein
MGQSPSWEANSRLASYEARNFLILFTTTRHLSLSWARRTQSTSLHTYFLKILFNIILLFTPASSLQIFRLKWYAFRISSTRTLLDNAREISRILFCIGAWPFWVTGQSWWPRREDEWVEWVRGSHWKARAWGWERDGRSEDRQKGEG